MIGRRGDHGAQSFDDAWTSRPAPGATSDLDAEVAELVRTAELVCLSAVAEPSARFREDLRARLITEAATLPAPEVVPAVRRHPTRRRFAGLTAAVVAGIATVGTISSSATAVPGDVLYPVKRGVESVQLAMHRDDASRGEFQLDQARERLAEAWWLDSNDRDDRVAEALDSFSDQATQGSTRLFDASTDGGSDTASAEAITTVNDFAADATVTLAKLSDDLPADARSSLEDAARTVTTLAAQASSLCSGCSAADLSSLTGAVEKAIAQGQPDLGTPPAATPDPAPTSGSSGSGTAQKPPAVVPTPKTATPPPVVKDLTDPVTGDLLGDEDQEGLVPRIVGGLLGGGQK